MGEPTHRRPMRVTDQHTLHDIMAVLWVLSHKPGIV